MEKMGSEMGTIIRKYFTADYTFNPNYVIKTTLPTLTLPESTSTDTIIKEPVAEPKITPVILNPETNAIPVSTILVPIEAPVRLERKGAVPADDIPTVDENIEWDGDDAKKKLAMWAGGLEKDKVDWDKYKRGFAWFDSEAKDNFTSYKLPHHTVIDGKIVTVWNGVRSAMGALLGASGGTDIPVEDGEKVYNHLKNEYTKFKKDVPEFKQYTLEDKEKEFINGLREEIILENLYKEIKSISNRVSK